MSDFLNEVVRALPAGNGARVALGMSGGVDSSVAAILLQQAGYEVIGVTCIFIDDESAQHAVQDAQVVAEKLGIAHHVHHCAEAFEHTVISNFCEAYAQGKTPSPCVTCNKTCKIPQLLEAADALGCHYVATGHYARIKREPEIGRLAVCVAAHDAKDQSYMLSQLSQEQLGRLVLPLGGIAQGKARIREIAAEHGLGVASKSDSQDICFIQGSHLDFLENRGIVAQPGDIVTQDGTVVGSHNGLFRYTLGQRKGLLIGGAPEPYYVIGKRFDENQLVVGFAKDAQISTAWASDLVWQGATEDAILRDIASEDTSYVYTVKLRYRTKAASCALRLEKTGEGVLLRIDLAQPQQPTAPGQFAVIYRDGVVMASGVIVKVSR